MSVTERLLAPPKTISETIYQHVKTAIIAGELKPGQRIQEKDFSALFRVSATPVREAFFRLAAEKFLVISARKEVLVQGASLEEVRELYEVVRALDKYALKKLAGRLSARDTETLRAMTAKLGEHYSRDDHRNYLDQNLQIHDWLWRTNGNRALHETLSQLMEKIAIYRKHSGFTPFADRGALEKSYRDHVGIMRAIIEGDGNALEAILALHWGEEFIEPRRDEPPCPPAGGNRNGIHEDRRR
jgi:DNA-binding GntR family transcriptional regulator